MKRLYSLLVVLISGLSIYLQPLYASDFEYKGFKYTILSKENKTVELTEKPANGLKGDIVLPSIVIDPTDSTNYTLTSIGDMAFTYGGKSFTGITIPNTVKSIKSGAFHCCFSLERVILPDSLEELGKSAFIDCALNSAIILPNTLKTLGSRVFCNNSSLPEVKLPDNLKEIPDSLFFNCRRLKSPVIPVGLERIGSWAFYQNYRIDTIVLPNSVRNIENCAFMSSGLRKIQMPESMEDIGHSTFSDCSKLEEFIVPKGITNIKSHTFSNDTSLRTIRLHPAVTTIEYYAFSGCKNLITFDFTNISRIGASAFTDCESIQCIDLPSNIEIGEYAFSKCTNLIHITLPSSTTWIDKSTFAGCKKLQTLVVGNEQAQDVTGAISIDDDAFSGFSELKSVIINKAITNIEYGAFSGCSSLSTFKCPEVISIGEMAFSGCSKLSEFNFEFIKKLGRISFGGCGFESVELPAIEEFDGSAYRSDGAFKGCPLKTVKIFGTISGLLLGCITRDSQKIETIVLGPNILSFKGGIDSGSFYNSFSDKLKNIYVLNPIPPNTGRFHPFHTENFETTILYVPKGTVEAYQKAPTWERFTHIVEIETSGIDDIVTTDDNITVEVIGNSILVNGDTGSFPIELYTLSGVCVYNGHNQIIDGLSKGFYILKVGTKTMKVIV